MNSMRSICKSFQTRKKIEERNGFISRLTGLLQGYKQHKTKLLEEIGQECEEIGELLKEQEKEQFNRDCKKPA